MQNIHGFLNSTSWWASQQWIWLKIIYLQYLKEKTIKSNEKPNIYGRKQGLPKKLQYSKFAGSGGGGDVLDTSNRPFLSSKTSHFRHEVKCKTFVAKVSFVCMIIKNHFHIMALHLASLWNRGLEQLGNSLLQNKMALLPINMIWCALKAKLKLDIPIHCAIKLC